MQRSTWTLYPLWSDTRHLFDTWGKKKRARIRFDTFSPGTEYHFARNSFFPQVWRLRAHHVFPVVKERPGIRHQCCWLQINIIKCWICVVDLPRPTWLSASNKPPAHQLYEVIRALRIWRGLRFVFDALTTDNSTGIRQKWKQQYPGIRRIYGA
jgi:hypothetical protein